MVSSICQLITLILPGKVFNTNLLSHDKTSNYIDTWLANYIILPTEDYVKIKGF